MKITPLDIQHKVLEKEWRGYHKIQVDQFLEEIAETVEELTKENLILKEKLSAKDDELGATQTSGIYIDQHLDFDAIIRGSTQARRAT